MASTRIKLCSAQKAYVEARVVHLCWRHCIGGVSVQADEAASWYMVGADHAVHHGKRRAATRALGRKRKACWPVLGAGRYSSRARYLLLWQQTLQFNFDRVPKIRRPLFRCAPSPPATRNLTELHDLCPQCSPLRSKCQPKEGPKICQTVALF